MLKEDPEGYVDVGYTDQKEIDYLFFQTSEMRRKMDEYPEVLSMDTTYKLNKNNMHLVVMQVVDNHGNGRTVGYCFVRRETKDIIKDTVKCLLDSNPDAVKKTQTVIVDKDYKEIENLRKLMPHVEVHLCYTHVKRQFERHSVKESKKSKVRRILDRMLNASSLQAFEALYKNYRRLQAQSL